MKRADEGTAATSEQKPGRSIQALFLPNVRQREKVAAFVPGSGPDPRRNTRLFAGHGVDKVGRDLNRFPLNPFARRGTFYAGFDPVRALFVMLRDRRVDVVVSTFETNIVLIAMLARLFGFRPRLVMWEVSGRGWRMRNRVLDYIVPRVDRVLVLTKTQKAHVEATYRLKAPAEVIGFAVDDEFYRPLPRVRQDFILAVGDDGGRDYDLLLAACRPTPYRLVLRTGCKLNIPVDMQDRVTVLGRQTYEELRELYATAAMVAVVVRKVDNPSGITAVFEAMAMQCAVIASADGVGSDILVDQETGILVPSDDAAGLTRAITKLMEAPATCEALGRRARQAIDGPLSYAVHIACFADSLRGVAEQRLTPLTPESITS